MILIAKTQNKIHLKCKKKCIKNAKQNISKTQSMIVVSFFFCYTNHSEVSHHGL